jgi:DNA-binding HxlR family transcriptional regulator
MTRPAVAPSDQRAIHATLVSGRQASDMICDRWSLAVVLAILLGERRYSGLAARTGIASRLLDARLKSLQESGVIVRMPYSMHPPRFEYHLTNMGADLVPVFLHMDRWEQDWRRDPPGSTSLVHRLCGAPLRTFVSCDACDRPASARDIVLKVSRAQLEKVPDKQARHRRSIVDSESLAGTRQILGPSLDIFGDKWGAEILNCAFFRIRRFNDFRESLGISANILSDRLERLVAAGILSRGRDPGLQSGYWLTPEGIDVYAIMVAIHAWADKWIRRRYRSPVRLIHQACGKDFWPGLTCRACGRHVRPADVDFAPAPPDRQIF